MPDFFDLLESLGLMSVEMLWLPLGAWTIAALVALALDAHLPLRRPLVRQRLLVALLAALPLGMTFRIAYPLLLPAPVSPALEFFVSEALPMAPAPGPTLEGTPDRPVLPLLAGASFLLLGLAAVAGCARLAAQHLRLYRWLHRLPVHPETTHHARAHGMIAQLRLPPMRLRLVDAEVSPFTCGMLRPVIVLPARLTGDDEAFRLALAHEAAHVAHGDALWHLAARLAAALVPWHPLAWRLLRQAELRREQAADAFVLGHFPIARRQYARLLLDFGAVPAPAAALAASVHQLKPRVAAMKNLLDLRARGIAPALLLLVSLSATLSLRAQDSPPSDDRVFVVVEEQPTILPNNRVGMENMQASLHYPEIARRAGVEGRVIVRFVVDELGNVVDPKIVRGIGAGCDEEALRAVRELRFTPGKQGGQTVKVQMTLPVTFKLSPEPPQPGTPQPAAASDGANTLQVVELQRSAGTISGRVLDRSTGMPLAGANVVLEGTQIGTATDPDGRFVFRGLPAATANDIRVSFVGFKGLVVPVTGAQMAAAPIPEGYRLDGMPNPTSDQTEITFAVPEAGGARVEVYNAIGQRVAVLFDEMAAAGQIYRVVFDGAAHESGVYFFRLTHEGHTMTRAHTLAR